MESKTRERWSVKSHPWRFALVIVAVTVLALAIGALLGTVANEADGAVAPRSGTSSQKSCVTDSNTPCPSVKKKHRKAARKFKAGKIHHSSGFKPGRVFKRPKAAKRIFVNRIENVLHKSGKQTAFAEPGCTNRCEAFKIYRRLAADANCVDRGRSFPIDPATCKYPDSTKQFTKQQIQTGGTAILCGGGVAIGVATSGATVGVTAFAAVWGATACGWSFWDAID